MGAHFTFFLCACFSRHMYFRCISAWGGGRSLSFRCKQEKKSNVIICLVLIGLTSVRASMSKELAFVQGDISYQDKEDKSKHWEKSTER